MWHGFRFGGNLLLEILMKRNMGLHIAVTNVADDAEMVVDGGVVTSRTIDSSCTCGQSSLSERLLVLPERSRFISSEGRNLSSIS